MSVPFLRWTTVVAIAVAGPAAAETAQQKASAAYQAGLEAFGAERFEEALRLFEHAYLLDNAPVLLFNMARAAEEMGNGERAVYYYELYVDRVPDARDRGEVERRVRVMKKLIAQEETTARPVATPPEPAPAAAPPVEPAPVEPEPATASAVNATPPPPRSPSRRRYAYASLGAAGLTAGASVWMGLEALDEKDAHDAAASAGEKFATAEDGESARLWANVFAGTAVVLAVTGVTLWMMEPEDESATIVPAPMDRGAGLVWSGRW